MSNDERREKRVDAQLKVRYKSATVNEFIEKHSYDISSGGVFIRSGTPPAKGTLLKIDFRLEDDTPVIQGVGRVVWSRKKDDTVDKPPGMGIKFIRLDSNSVRNIKHIIAMRKEGKKVTRDSVMPLPPVDGEATPSSPSATDDTPTDAPVDDSWTSSSSQKEVAQSGVSGVVSGVDDEMDARDEMDTADVPDTTAGRDDEEVTSSVDVTDERQAARRERETPAETQSEVAADTPSSQDSNEGDSCAACAAVSDDSPHRSSRGRGATLADKGNADKGTAASVAAEPSRVPVGGIIAVVIVLGVLGYVFFIEDAREDDPTISEMTADDEVAAMETADLPTKDVDVEATEDSAVENSGGVSDTAMSGTVTVTVRPVEATVRIDGTVLDKEMPHTMANLPVGPLSVDASLFGYQSVTQTISLEEGTDATVAIEMEPVPPRFVVNSTPEGAVVRMDNRRLGLTPLSTEVPPQKTFSWRVNKRGFEDAKGTVSDGDWEYVDGEYRVTLNLQLSPAPSTPTRRATGGTSIPDKSTAAPSRPEGTGDPASTRTAPEKSPEKTPEKAPEKSPEKTPEKTPEKSPEKTPEKAPEKSPETPSMESNPYG